MQILKAPAFFSAQPRVRRHLLVAGLGLVPCLGLLHGSLQAAPSTLRVYAAVSLKGPLDLALRAWREQGDVPVVTNYAGTPALVRQIDQGAPADLLISADAHWMDWLDARGALQSHSRRDLFANRLVLIAPSPGRAAAPIVGRNSPLSPGYPRIMRGSEPPHLPEGARLALADVRSVPGGRYAKAALDALGWSDRILPRAAMTENVRAALLLVARGEAALGIVYASDTVQERRVAVLGEFATDTHPPIRFPAAVLASSRHARAQALLNFLASEEAWSHFAAFGFSRPTP